jgi:ligand-binding sensor domain-containing protein/serine phosphatase RsbU (regulator of sigma subunit)
MPFFTAVVGRFSPLLATNQTACSLFSLWKVWLWLLLFFFCFALPEGLAQRYKVAQYNAEKGLVGDIFYKIYQDHKGFMWFASDKGVSRYDGIRFEHFEQKNQFNSRIVFTIFEDKKHRLWFGTYEGLSLYDPQKEQWTIFKNLRNVRNILEDTKGDLWIFAEHRLLHYDYNTWRVYLHNYDLIYSAVFLSEKELLFTTDVQNRHLVRLDTRLLERPILISVQKEHDFDAIVEKEKRQFQDAAGNPDVPFYQAEHLVYPADLLPRQLWVEKRAEKAEAAIFWVGTEDGLYRVQGRATQRQHLDRENSAQDSLVLTFQRQAKAQIFGRVRDLWTDKKGNLYITSVNGLFVWDRKAQEEAQKIDPFIETDFLTRYDKRSGFAFSNVLTAYLDRDENLWLGFFDNLVEKLQSKKFVAYTNQNNDFEGQVLQFGNSKPIEDQYGNLNFLTTKGFYRFNGREFHRHLPLLEGYHYYFIDTQNRIWVRTFKGFAVFTLPEDIREPLSYRLLDQNSGLPAPLQKLIDYPERWYVGKDGKILIGTYFGLFIYEEDAKGKPKWTFVEPRICKAIASIAQDAQGDIWIGSWCAIERIREGKVVESFHKIADAQDTTLQVADPPALLLQADSKGGIWIGTINKGLLYCDSSKKMHIFQQNKGLRGNEISNLLLDKDQNVWVIHEAGIDILPKGATRFEEFPLTFSKSQSIQNINFLAESPDSNIWLGTSNGLFRYANGKVQAYDKNDGLLNNKPQTHFYHQKENHAYFVHAEGIVRYQPQYDKQSENNPQLLLRRIAVNDSLYQLRDTLIITEGISTLRLEFALLQFRNEDQTEYSYFMQGLDEKWSEYAPYHFAKYTNLAPNTYRFKIRAKTKEGVEYHAEKDLVLIIKPLFYQTFLFQALLVFLVVAILGFFYRLRNRQIQAQKQRLERVIEQRLEEIKQKNAELELSYHEMESQKEVLTDFANELKLANEQVLLQNRALQYAHEEITASLHYAQSIQQAMLPNKAEMLQAVSEILILYLPRDIVSGDFYWYAHREIEGRKHHIFAALDCTGHGVPGAFMSLVGNDLLNNAVYDLNLTQPQAILNHLHQNIKRIFKKQGDGMDATLLTLVEPTQTPSGETIAEGEVWFAAAIQTLLAFVPKSSTTAADFILEEYKGEKISVGTTYKKGDELFTLQKLPCQKGTTYYLFSDGYADQFGGAKNKKFTKKRLKETLLQLQHLPLAEQEIALHKTLKDWIQQGTEQQTDDIMIIGIKI